MVVFCNYWEEVAGAYDMIGATVPLVAKASEVWFVWVGSIYGNLLFRCYC